MNDLPYVRRLSRDTAWFERARGRLDRLSVLDPLDAPLAVSEQRYLFDAPLSRVVEEYVHVHPAVAWPRRRIAFQYAFAAGRSDPIGASDAWPGLHEGMRVFADLFVDRPHGILRIFVPVLVTRLRPSAIRYDYLEGAVTAGWNEISFAALGPRTEIRHRSEYRGTSTLTRLLMPLLQRTLHVGFVDALHGEMKRRVERQEEAS